MNDAIALKLILVFFVSVGVGLFYTSPLVLFAWWWEGRHTGSNRRLWALLVSLGLVVLSVAVR